MATTKTTNLTNKEAATIRDARLTKARLVAARDKHAYTTGQLAAAEIILTDIDIPSNAIISEVLMQNDDLDSNGTPALTFDIGLFASEDFTSTTSSTDTKHNANDVLDADVLCDDVTNGQAASLYYAPCDLDAGTLGPDDSEKALWELLGYDEDPLTQFRVGITTATGAATAAAGDVSLEVRFLKD